MFRLTVVLFLSMVIVATAQTPRLTQPGGVAKIDITEHSDHDAGTAGAIFDAATKLAWPATVLVLLLVYKGMIGGVVSQFGQKGGEISVAGLAIKFPIMQAAPLGDDVLSFKATDPVMITSDSMKTTLLRLLREPGEREYVVIRLGEGQEWVTSRLFIFTIMLQTMKAVRCIVFLDGSVPKFLGIARPDRIRWALARYQPCLEKAYLTAVGQGIQFQQEPFVNNGGAVDPQVAENVVRGFVREVGPNSSSCAGAQPPNGKQWATLGNSLEYGVWLSGSDIKEMLADDLYKEVVVESSEHRSEAKALLQLTAPWVARLKTTGEFLSLIDRTAFINGVVTRLLARAEMAQMNKQ